MHILQQLKEGSQQVESFSSVSASRLANIERSMLASMPASQGDRLCHSSTVSPMHLETACPRMSLVSLTFRVFSSETEELEEDESNSGPSMLDIGRPFFFFFFFRFRQKKSAAKSRAKFLHLLGSNQRPFGFLYIVY